MATEKIVIVDTASVAWVASTTYDTVGTVVTNDSGKHYTLVTAGTSASSGGPTGTGTGISDGTCVWDYYLVHYSGLNAAIVGETSVSPLVITDADLVTNDEQLTISCRASRGPDGTHTVDGTSVSWGTSWVTDSTCYIKVFVPESHRHNGVFSLSPTHYRLHITTLTHNFEDTPSYTQVIGLEISNTQNRGIVTLPGDNSRWDQCLFQTSSSGHLARIFLTHSSNFTFTNCVYRCTNDTPGVAAFDGWVTGDGTTNFYNCTVYNAAIGFNVDVDPAAVCNIKNCISINCSINDFSLHANVSVADYNLSSDATASGTNSITNANIKAASDLLTAAEKVDAVTGVSVNAGGTGYVVDDILELTNASATDKCTVRVSTVSEGVITAVTLGTGGHKYSVGTYNVTGGTGADAVINVTSIGTPEWVIFTDPASGDFSLHSEVDGSELNDAIDAGADLSASVDAVDIIGTTRPQGSAWDIGAFEYLADASDHIAISSTNTDPYSFYSTSGAGTNPITRTVELSQDSTPTHVESAALTAYLITQTNADHVKISAVNEDAGVEWQFSKNNSDWFTELTYNNVTGSSETPNVETIYIRTKVINDGTVATNKSAASIKIEGWGVVT